MGKVTETTARADSRIDRSGYDLLTLRQETKGQLSRLRGILAWSKANRISIDRDIESAIIVLECLLKQIAPAADEPVMSVKSEKEPTQKIKRENRTEVKPKKKKIKVDSSRRPIKVVGEIKCDQCRKKHYDGWQYFLTDGSRKTLCRYCRGRELGYKKDALDHAVSGGAFGSNRRKF